MPSFQYRARDKQGSLVTGSLEAENKSQLESALDRMGLIPIQIMAKGRSLKLPGLDSFQKISPQDLILFSRQLATLFGAGVPLTRALYALERQVTNPKFVQIIKAIREEVEGGASLSAAISKHKEFPELYANMIEAGEAGGILEGVLDRLAFMLEKTSENKSKVKSATLYPKILIGAIVAAVVVLMNFVVPKFGKLYASFQIELPLPTRILIVLSDAFVNYWYIALVFFIVLYLGFRSYLKTESGRLNWDNLSLRIPVFGTLAHKSILSRFSRVLGSLYKSGLPILQSLDIVSRAVENKAIAADIKRIEEEVRAGKSLTEPMSKSRHFPPMMLQMVAVGEDTGNLDEMLEKVAQYYDQEVDATIRNLTTLLEPILLSFIFAMVLFLALAIFLPMWDIMKIVRR